MLRSSDTIIIDADALIAVFDPADKHFQSAFSILKHIHTLGASLLYPSTTIVEAVTTFQRKLNNQTAVRHILARIKEKEFIIEPVDQPTIDEAATLFRPEGSKQNTLFDAIVAAVAKKNNAIAIFSFDQWYKKVGFRLAGELL
jgi:predicted nucleic acid-binding protein